MAMVGATGNVEEGGCQWPFASGHFMFYIWLIRFGDCFVNTPDADRLPTVIDYTLFKGRDKRQNNSSALTQLEKD
jgi:hypothetical protein